MATKLSRFYYATTYYNKYYLRMLKWVFKSKEDTNFTYDLTDENKLVLAQFVAHLTGISLNIIKSYLKEIEGDLNLQQHIKEQTSKSNLRYKADSNALYGRRLGWYAIVRAIKPHVVIETGVDKGLGSLVLCSALKKNKEEGFNGRYYGTDIDPKAGYLLCGEYSQYGEILYGDSIESLLKFDKKIDLFINDSDHSIVYEAKEYIAIKDKLSEHALILSDNAHCSPELSFFAEKENKNFSFFKEDPLDHWYPGGGIGASW